MSSSTLSDETVLERIITRSQELYSLPSVAARVMELTRQETVDLRELKRTMEIDPALTSKMLRVANSAYYGMRSEVTNLTQALNLLGGKLVKTLTLSFCLPENLVSGLDAKLLDRYWRTTVYRAVIARRLAPSFGNLPAEELFIAALLQDIGVLALVQELGEAYAEFIQHVASEGATVSEQEIKVLGFTHTYLSARMLTHWGLPETLLRVIASSTSEEVAQLSESEKSQADLLSLSNLAAEFLISGQPSALLRTLNAATLLRESARGEIRELLVKMEAEVISQAALFSLTPPPAGEFERLMAAAEEKMLGVNSNIEPPAANSLPETKLLNVVNDLREELQSVTRAMRIKHSAISPPLEALPVVHLRDLARECPVFIKHVRAAVGRCRAERCSLGLVMVAIDPLENTPRLPREVMTRLVGWMRRVCVWETEIEERVIALGDQCFSILLDDCDRSNAVETARRILDRTGKRFTAHLDQIRFSAGVAILALPPRNFPERELIDVAVRCLQGAQASGGGSVKSYEM